MVIDGIKDLYIFTSNPGGFSDNKITAIAEPLTVTYAENFRIDEIEYILLSAMIEFFRKVQTMVNARVGYTTDAFSVTNADKPYLHLADTIKNLDSKRITIHHKFASSML